MVSTANQIFRNFEIEGVSSSGAHEPSKSELRAWGSWIEGVIAAFTANGGLIYSSKGAMDGDLVHPANTMAWVVGDPVPANNGIYGKLGASGGGSWARRADLPFSFIVATDVGNGTPNAIQAGTSIPVSGSALVWTNIFEANTSSPVTISFNGGTPLTIKTNSGNDPVAGGLTAGMIAMGIVSGSTFRLVSDQASAALLAACEDAVQAASDYANFARNNWVIACADVGTGSEHDYLLTIDPGAVNNMFVVVGGVLQLVSQNTYTLVHSGGNHYIRINVPAGIPFDVRVGNSITVGTPSDGSVATSKIADSAVTTAKINDAAVTTAKINDAAVTTAKINDKAVTLAKVQDIATASLLGRVTAATGVPEVITAAQLRDNFFPTGSVVDSVSASYATNADLTTQIPSDDTIPQITEGTQILSVTITPKSTTNKLRIRFTGWAAVSAIAPINYAIFNGGANAIQAGSVAIGTNGYYAFLCGEVEYVPGATTLQTITVRVGPGGAVTVRMNGSSSARIFGGASAARLVVEEIKA